MSDTSSSAFSPAEPTTPAPPRRTTKETHPNLPPGLILDAEGKVCKVCNSWQDWGKAKFSKKAGAGSGGQSGSGSISGKSVGGSSSFAGMMAAAAATSSSTSSPSSSSTTTSKFIPDRAECPADTVALGRATWTFLHTTAAYYPLTAPPSAQRQMLDLLSSLSLLYPCTPCASDFQTDMRANPPDVTGREALSRWLCERHNEVNEKLGKKRFECDWGNLNKRWKDGPEDGSCD